MDTAADTPPAENPPADNVSAGDDTVDVDSGPDILPDGDADNGLGDVSDDLWPDAMTAKAAEVEPEADEYDANDEGQTVGTVDLPCRVHYPNGWPVEELGAWANCPHGHGIRYGETVEIGRERAVELGFLEEPQ